MVEITRCKFFPCLVGIVFLLVSWTALSRFGVMHRSNNIEVSDIVVELSFNINSLFGKKGVSTVRFMYDVDGDGEKELICNVGAQSHFVAIENDMTIAWENILNTVQHKSAYYPKIHDGILYYGDRSNDTIYAIDLSNGTLKWSVVRNGLVALNISNQGVVYGASDGIGILDYNTGKELSGWPFPFAPHEQILVTGDLDEDGEDEIFSNDNSGNIKAIDNNGTEMFTIQSFHTHVDMMFIGDIDPHHLGNEFVTVVDDDNSALSEGDEIVIYDVNGNQMRKYTASSGFVNLRVGDILLEKPGLEIAFVQEDHGILGLLDCHLNEIWKLTGIGGRGSTSQIQLADVNGDGKLEILTNKGESIAAGFMVFNSQGELLYTKKGLGWDFDPRLDVKTGEPFSSEDIDKDGKDEIMPGLLGSNNFTDNEIIRILGEEIKINRVGGL